MKLAVGMIVKNESKVIERCLNSIKDIVDILIISDTGSTDNTIEIIKNFCTKNKIKFEIYRNEWKNFGTNRTELLRISKNKSDYLLLLDADESVVLNNFKKETLCAPGYHLRYSGNLDYAQVLLINNRLSWKYFGVTHEYIALEENENVFIENLDSIKMVSYNDGSNRVNKFQRDIELLEQGIKDEPNNARYYFYLANSYRDSGDYKKAIEMYQKRISLGGWEEEIFYSYYQIGVCQEMFGNSYDAKDAYLEAFEFRPTRAEPLYRLSVLCRNLREYQQAYLYSNKGLEISYPKDLLFIDKSVYDYLLLFERSIAAYYIGDYKLAYDDSKTLLSKEYVSPSIKNQTRINIRFSEEKLFGKIITSHFDKESALKVLKEAIVIFRRLGVQYFLQAGTLLGYARNGDFLDHDDDIDIGIIGDDISEHIKDEFVKEGFAFSLQLGKKFKNLEYRFYKYGIQLDLFFNYYEVGGERIYCGVFDNNGQAYKFLYSKFNINFVDFKGIKVGVPEDVEKYLREQYGQDWKVENKNWNYLEAKNKVKLEG